MNIDPRDGRRTTTAEAKFRCYRKLPSTESYVTETGSKHTKGKVYEDKTQHANFQGTPLYQTTK